jgi:hypothetical protein
MASPMRIAITVLTQGLFISAVLLAPLVVGYFNNAPAFIGILFWFELVVIGFPWNIVVATVCDFGFEQTYFPGLFASLNQNHDRTVGYFMFVGYVSLFINSFFIAWLLYLRRNRKDNQNAKPNA